jgi:hypothetical protein
VSRVLAVDEVALLLAEAQPDTLPVVTAVELALALTAAGYRVVADDVELPSTGRCRVPRDAPARDRQPRPVRGDRRR